MYKLMVLDSHNRETVVFENKDIQEVDYFTYQFVNKKELLEQGGRVFNSKFQDVYIASMHDKKRRNIRDIMYQDYIIPSDYELCDRYSFFLLADRSRVRRSFINNLPNIRDINLKYLSSLDIINAVVKHMNTYRKKRDCYFELVNNGVIKVEEGKIRRNEDKIVDKSSDYDIEIELEELNNRKRR